MPTLDGRCNLVGLVTLGLVGWLLWCAASPETRDFATDPVDTVPERLGHAEILSLLDAVQLLLDMVLVVLEIAQLLLHAIVEQNVR